MRSIVGRTVVAGTGTFGHSSRPVAMIREVAQEVAVGLAETHRVGQRGEHLRRRSAIATLFEPDEVVDADAGEDGELGATQPGRAATGADRQADVGGRHGFAPRAQERSQLSDVHDTKCASVRGRRRVAPVGPGLSRPPAGPRIPAWWSS